MCCYRAANPTVSPSDIESSTQKIADEFTAMGIDLKTALKNKVGDRHQSLLGAVTAADAFVGLEVYLTRNLHDQQSDMVTRDSL